MIVMSTTQSGGKQKTITYKENYLFRDITIQTWLARLLTFFTQQRTLLTKFGMGILCKGLRKMMQFQRSGSLNFLISLADNLSERIIRRYLLFPPFRNPHRNPFDWNFWKSRHANECYGNFPENLRTVKFLKREPTNRKF